MMNISVEALKHHKMSLLTVHIKWLDSGFDSVC